MRPTQCGSPELVLEGGNCASGYGPRCHSTTPPGFPAPTGPPRRLAWLRRCSQVAPERWELTEPELERPANEASQTCRTLESEGFVVAFPALAPQFVQTPGATQRQLPPPGAFHHKASGDPRWAIGLS